MTTITSTTDVASLSLTVVAEFDASPAQVWEVWRDPRKLERWWGPPAYPATFTRHEFVVGGESRYFMTGPAGHTPRGWWRIEAIDAPRRLSYSNGLAGADGEPVPDVPPMPSFVTFEGVGDVTRMTVVSTYVDVAQMEKMLEMGMQEGMEQAVSQIDALLSAATV
jgi:uncharacterized protein YndB with AHSA1/START domain